MKPIVRLMGTGDFRQKTEKTAGRDAYNRDMGEGGEKLEIVVKKTASKTRRDRKMWGVWVRG